MKTDRYFDYNSTTPINPKVNEIVHKTMLEQYGNPSSLYGQGRKAKELLEESRQIIAQNIGAQKEEIYFTSGGTEANNMAIKGLQNVYRNGKNHIITSCTEHSSVYETVKSLMDKQVNVTILGVDSYGMINLEELKEAISEKTALISIMMANNETGTIENIDQIVSIARKNKVLFHSDGVQALGKIPINVNNPSIDMLSLSAHKIYGPKGIGALYVRRGVSMIPLLHGGAQESRLRSGTENVPLIAGFAKACEISKNRYDKDTKHMIHLKKTLYRGLNEKIKCLKLNGTLERSLPNTLNLSFPGCESETLILDLDSKGFQVSAGSACSAKSSQRSRVLKSMGLQANELFSALRFSMGRETKESEVLKLIETLSKIIDNFV